MQILGGSLASSTQAVNQARAPLEWERAGALIFGTASLQNCGEINLYFLSSAIDQVSVIAASVDWEQEL